MGGAACAVAVGLGLWRRHTRHLSFLLDADPLTGLANRRVIDRLGSVDCWAACVVYVDVDRFKCVNDHHGHAAGDLLLQVVANLLRSAVRPGDVVARVGGDEFVLVLRDCTCGEALAVVARVQRGLSGGEHGCTISAGVCEVPATPDGVAVPLIDSVGAADVALGEAKRRGRGAVVVAAPPGGRLSPAGGSGAVRARPR